MYRGSTEKLQPEIEMEEKCSSCEKVQLSAVKNTGWHRIAVYHCDDDIDITRTFKYYDVCSFDCYLKQVRKSVNELEASKTARIDGMDLAFVRKFLFFYGF